MSEKITLVHMGESIYLDLSRSYPASPTQQVAIQSFTMDHQPWATITTCIPEAELASNETILNTNNLPEMLVLLSDIGLIKDTGRVARSGFCTYPIVELLKKAG